jgi:hypothetical protein
MFGSNERRNGDGDGQGWIRGGTHAPMTDAESCGGSMPPAMDNGSTAPTPRIRNAIRIEDVISGDSEYINGVASDKVTYIPLWK